MPKPKGMTKREYFWGWLLLQFQWRRRLELFFGWLALQAVCRRQRRQQRQSQHIEGWQALVAAENIVWCADVRARIRRVELRESVTVSRILDPSGALHYDTVPLFLARLLGMRRADIRALDINAIQRAWERQWQKHEYYRELSALATHPALPARAAPVTVPLTKAKAG